MIRRSLLGIIALAFLQSPALGQMHTQHASEAACDEPTLRCATKATSRINARTSSTFHGWPASTDGSGTHNKGTISKTGQALIDRLRNWEMLLDKRVE